MSEFSTDVRSDFAGVEETESPAWQPLESVQRRVLGVLVEKAKTTPDAYPLTLNAITTGCNQKSNRKPQMQLDAEDVQQALDELREMGAVVEVQGDGRAAKYRHKAYGWLNVDKVELAVLAELFLRGEQTVGELRARAARMEPIEGLTELRPILSSLRQKELLLELTPEGRGQIITHALYPADRRPSAESADIAHAARGGLPEETKSHSDLELIKRELRELTERVAVLEQQLER